jgi:hypothetical protein
MAEKRTIELEVVSNSENAQKQFKDLRSTIKSTTEQIEELTKEFGENSNEVSEAKKQLNELKNSYSQLSKSATDLSASFEDVYGEMQPLTARMGEAEDRLYELALAGKQSTKEYRDLLQTVGKYKRVQMETDMVVDAASMTMANKLVGALGGVASGAEVATGAMGLFGVESEEVQQTMLKVQSAMAIAQGIQGLRDAGKVFSSLGTKIKDVVFWLIKKNAVIEAGEVVEETAVVATVAQEVASSGLTTAQTGVAVTTALASNAMKLFRIALISTGIGAIVVAVGLLIANFDKVTAAVMSARERFEKLGTGVKIVLSILFPFVGIIYGITKALEAMGVIDDVKTAKLKKNAEAHTEAVIKSANKRANAIKKEQTQNDAKAQREIDLAKASGKATYEMELSKAKAHLKTGRVFLEVQKSKMKAIKAEMDLLLETEDKDSDRYKELKKRTEAVRNIIDETYKDNVDTKRSIEIMETEHQKEMADKAKAAGDKAKQTAEQNRKAYIDNLKKQNDDQAKLEEEAENQKLALMQDGIDKEKALRQDAFNDYRDNFLKERTQEEQAALDKQYESGKISREEYNKAVEELRLNAESKLTEQERQILVNAKDLLNKDLLAIDEKHQAEVKKRTEDFQKKMQEDEKKRRLDFDMQIEQLQEQNYQQSLTEQQREIYLLEEKYAEMQLLAQGNADAEKTIAEAKGRELDEINKKYDEEDKARREAALQRNADLAKSGLSAISDLTELFGKKSEKQAKRAFQIKKAASISSALIDTFLSARSAYYSQFTPVPDPSSPVRGGIAAGIAVASGLIGVAKIASQKFEGGGSVSGGGGAEGGGGGMGGGSQAPSFNVVGNNGINQLAQLQQQPTQAYVVSGQVTTAQSLDRNRVQNATL